MDTNRELARRFEEMAAALELLGANPFRAVSHRRVARLLRDLGSDVRTLAAGDDRLAALCELPGVGKASAEKIVEFLDEGEIGEHRELFREVPPGLLEVLAIPGVGPKAAKAMWEELGIASLADLKAKLATGELAALPRMGKKSIENIEKAIRFSERGASRVLLGQARPVAMALLAELREIPGVVRAEVAGSLRRGRETIGDLDFVVSCDDPAAVRERFTAHPWVTQVLAAGETKSSVRLAAERVELQADLRIVPLASFGAALLYFTGSKEHNVRLRELAVQRGLRLNEYGLYEGTEERPQELGKTPLAAAEEEAIYRALGFSWVPPELREDRGELDGPPPRLIEIGDVRAELHSHTTASDGKHTIEEIARFARDRGFHTLAITDHSPSQVLAGGLEPDRLRRHLEAVREAAARVDGIRLLAGAEVDILIDGSLDYADELLAELDVVVASPHQSLRQDPATATARLLRAVRHPLVHVLGHPTGRVVNRREGLEPDLDAVFAAAREHDVALELNANPHRLDLRDTHLRRALAHGCKIAIDCDVHHERDFDHLVYGVLTARRAGLTAESCVNAWDAERLHGWLAGKRGRADGRALAQPSQDPAP